MNITNNIIDNSSLQRRLLELVLALDRSSRGGFPAGSLRSAANKKQKHFSEDRMEPDSPIEPKIGLPSVLNPEPGPKN